MNYILFIDESGDHGLKKVDPQFPVFTLCGILIKEEDYDNIKSGLNQIKDFFWKDKKVILHSRDIRKCEKEFVVLFDLEVKKLFYEKLNAFLQESKYSAFISTIKKEDYINKFGKITDSVYEISVSSVVDETIKFLSSTNEIFSLKLIFEKRGKSEDRSLLNYMNSLKSNGTQTYTGEDLSKLTLDIDFKDKKENINGLQIADLIAYPAARFIIDKERANPAYDLISSKIKSFIILP